MRYWPAACMLLLAVWQSAPACAHELDPGYLELSALGHEHWRVTWRIPDVGGVPMSLAATLPDRCEPTDRTAPHFDGRGWSTVFITHCPGGLVGGRVVIDGLEKSRTDVLLRYETSPGNGATARLTAGQTHIEIPTEAGHAEVFSAYVVLGVTHILEGIDHLLFVLALLLLVRNPRRLLLAVTAFTLAHSITLAAAATGWLRVPSSPVEVVIALSIVFLAWELTKPPERRDPIAERFPAVVSFSFGLVHGLGFAGALREIGLPRYDILTALFAFNLGVELGQIIFIVTVLGFGFFVRRVAPRSASWRPIFSTASSYIIGSLATFWMLERLGNF